MRIRKGPKLIQFLAFLTQLNFIQSLSTSGYAQFIKRQDSNPAPTSNQDRQTSLLNQTLTNTSNIIDQEAQEDNGGIVNRIAPLIGDPNQSYRPETYIVILSKNATASRFISQLKMLIDQDMTAPQDQSKIGYVYAENILHGFSARLVGRAFEFVARSPEVEAIVPDTKMTTLPILDSISEYLSPTGVSAESADGSAAATDSGGGYLIQKGTAPWNLQRMSQRPKITANGKDPGKTIFNYSYQEPDGKGVIVYVLDTGARATHADFEGRVEFAAQFGGYAMWDGNGHGTHCAGVITGRRWGVAKAAKVRAVKVLSDEGGGATSDIIAGIQFVVDQFRKTGYPPTVASLSLGGGRNTALDRVVQNAIDLGVHFVVAAGNNNGDSCLSSPAACPDANVVAASDIDDTRAPYSNWGSCVDFFAPGSNVTSAWYSSDKATARISGTSMAAPHVAALMAYHLSQHNMSTKAMTEMLRRNSNHGVLSLRADDVLTHDMVSATPNLLM
ncbi:subtilisin protease [Melampsora americana]|nr:subtilisin protease [Melampsora americana]